MMRSDLLIRCDGSPELGLGHVVRCLAIAEAYTANGAPAPTFLMQDATLGAERVRAAGFAVLPVAPDQTSGSGFVAHVEQAGALGLCVDVRDDLARDDLEALCRTGLAMAVLDDASERRLAADLVFYPPVPQVEALNWDGFRGERLIGWDWIPLRKAFAAEPVFAALPKPRLLISMGGTDPQAMTLRVLQVLTEIEQPFICKVVVGAGCPHRAAIRNAAAALSVPCEYLESVPDMAAVMRSSDLAITAFGMTAYELAASGVPALYLCASDDHERSASALMDTGAGINLGQFATLEKSGLTRILNELLTDSARRCRMAQQARAAIDGRGAERIAERLIALLARDPMRTQVRA